MPELLKGQVLHDEVSGMNYRILYIPEEESENTPAYWICMDSGTNIPKPFFTEDIRLRINTSGLVCVTDPWLSARTDETSLSQASIAVRDKAYELIKDIVVQEPDIYDIHKRSALLKEKEKQSGVKSNNLYNYLGQWWRNGMNRNALIPKLSNCGTGRGPDFQAKKKLGRPGKKGENGKILVQKDLDHFRNAIDKYYLKDTKPSLKKAYNQMITHMYTRKKFAGDTDPEQLPEDEKPSYMQFYYWVRKNCDVVEKNRRRSGEGKYELKHRGITGRSETKVYGPGMVGQIDATIGDFYLVSELDRNQFIGRPVVFFLKDVRTRIITGLHITLDNASWRCALMTLKNAAEDKVEFCRRYGIDIEPEDWPCHHLPVSITADNGEMGDKGVEELITSLGITIENTPPYRGDLKAIIENNFNLHHMMMKDIVPGYVDKDAGQRGSKDRKQEACIDLKTFTRLIIRSVLYYNNSHYMADYERTPEMREHGVRPIPRELWNYGMQYETGALRTVSPDTIYRHLLEPGQASVTEKGIVYNGLYYTCEKAVQEMWYDKARINGRWKVSITADPSCVDHIYLILPENETVRCSLLERSDLYSGRSEADIARYKEEDAREKAAYAQVEEKALNHLILEIEKDVKRCTGEKRKDAKNAVSKALKKNNVNVQRQKEKDHLSGADTARQKQKEMMMEQYEDPEEYETARSAIDESIDQVLKDSGLL